MLQGPAYENSQKFKKLFLYLFHKICVLMRCNGRLQGFKRDELNAELFLNLRYDGTDVPVMTQCAEGDDYAKVGSWPDRACNLCL